MTFKNPFAAIKYAIETGTNSGHWDIVKSFLLDHMTTMDATDGKDITQSVLELIEKTVGIVTTRDSDGTFTAHYLADFSETVQNNEAKFFKTIVRFEVLSAANPFVGNLDDAMYETSEGLMLGRQLESVSMEISAAEAAAALIQSGNEIEMFAGLEDAQVETSK